MTDPTPSDDTRAPGRAIGVGVALALLVFARTIAFGFTDWDDPTFIIGNPLVTAPLSHGWIGWLTTPEMGYPQPLTVLTHHLDYRLGGGAAWPFHLGNVLLHAACAALVAANAATYGRAKHGAWMAGALLAGNPLVVEPVAWATGRKDLLATLCVLGAFAAWRRWRLSDGAGAVWPALALAAAVLGLGAKPVAVVAPVLIAADALLVPGWRDARRVGALLAAMSVPAAALVALSMTSQQALGVVTDAGVGARLLFASQHFALQIEHVVLPVGLAPKYLEELPAPLASAGGLQGALVALGWAAGAALAAARGRRVLALGLVWVAVAFAPSSGLVPIYRGPADVYMYVALPGLALAAAVAWSAVAARSALVARVGGVALLVACSGLAWMQTDAWRSPSALWSTLVERYPDSRRAWWALADAMMAEGRPRDAIAVYETALPRFAYPPEDMSVVVSMAEGCAALGDPACAVRWFGELLRHERPTSRRALGLLGVWDRAPYPEYAAEHDAAVALLRRELGALDGADDAALAAWCGAQVAAPGWRPLDGLVVMTEDAEVGAVAGRLRAMGASCPPAGATPAPR